MSEPNLPAPAPTFAAPAPMLDGAAHSTSRPGVEASRRVRDLSADTSWVQEILEERLPQAGARAKRISGDFHQLRRHLNENASHFAFTRASLRHILDPVSREVRTEPVFSLPALQSNLTMVFVFLYFTVFEAVRAVGAAGIGNEDLVALRGDLHRVGMHIVAPRTPATV